MSDQTGVTYVAISHVWSHGLGNNRANSLPRCQLERLSTLVNEVSGQRAGAPTYFWIDTLSWPVEREEATNLAIVYMRKTYAKAEIVSDCIY